MLGIVISCDNQAAKTTAGNDLYNGWKRTMQIYHAHVSILLKKGVITMIDIRSPKNSADLFTKGPTREFVENTSKGIWLMLTL